MYFIHTNNRMKFYKYELYGETESLLYVFGYTKVPPPPPPPHSTKKKFLALNTRGEHKWKFTDQNEILYITKPKDFMIDLIIPIVFDHIIIFLITKWNLHDFQQLYD